MFNLSFLFNDAILGTEYHKGTDRHYGTMAHPALKVFIFHSADCVDCAVLVSQ